jgi:plastocyanin
VAGGNSQRIAVGRQALTALTVTVRDADGSPVLGATVNWSVAAGAGWVSSATRTTNAQGRAAVNFTAGAAEEVNIITAAVDGLTPATFTVRAVHPATVTITGGDMQSARLGVELADELEVVVRAGDECEVLVRAGDNCVVPGAAVQWQVVSGGGQLLDGTATATDGEGLTSNRVQLGPATGANSVSATAVGTRPIAQTFGATATQPVKVTVTMQDTAFNAPGGGDDITIQLGDTVSWVNNDLVQHTATSNSSPSGGATFDSPLLNQGQTFTFVPNVRGMWIYFCRVHPGTMLDARITVN